MKTNPKLTTFDNPFSPHTQFEEWYNFDVLNGYNTLSFLARITKVPENLPQFLDDIITNELLDEIIVNDPLNIYVKVFEDTKYPLKHPKQI